tara:strand:- start:327 stop:1673 length:1347 start_codon:yes stop_codon:yes gene_type:complete
MAHHIIASQTYHNTPSKHGAYQFTALEDIITYFMTAYVGEDKLIPKVRRVDVGFHAHRAMQELSFDTFKSFRSLEFLMPGSLQVILPRDYVNYTKISWIDNSGIKHRILPTSLTSSVHERFQYGESNPYQNSDGEFALTAVGDLTAGVSNIVLDGEYLNIKVGMQVYGPYIPSGTVVGATSNSGGITTVGLQTTAGVAVTPTFAGSEITFKFESGASMVHDADSTHVIESLSWNITDYKITAAATSDFDNIEVGMRISHDDFSYGARVVNVDKVNGVIITNSLPSLANSNGEITFIDPDATPTMVSNYKSKNLVSSNTDLFEDGNGRYGLDPKHANANGSFYIDENAGKINFSSNLAGKTIVLDYLGDSISKKAMNDEVRVHKFAEEAVYKHIIYAILSTRANVQEYVVRRFKKEKFAATRTAKLRLSNIKLEEIIQDLRGKSKQIKH